MPVRGTSRAGRIGGSAPGPDPADTTNPTVAIASPIAGVTVSGTITVAFDANDDRGVVGVQLKVDGSNSGAEDVAPPWSAVLDTTALSNAAHTLGAVARDAAGNTGTAATVVVTVNNAAAPPPPPPPPPPAPDITVTGNGVSIVDGDATPSGTDHTAFGTTVQSSGTITRTFTISNPGSADLTISSLTVPTGFTIVEGISATISASGSDTFQVRLDDAVVGSKTGDISFATNVTGKNPFNFAISGTVSAPPPPPPPPGLLTTRTLNNTSGSTQAGGVATPSFGVQFKQGDIPSGQYPVFKKTDGTVLATTIYGVSTWDDGSMAFCGAIVRWPDSIAGSGTATIEIHSGGTAPAASSRSTSDLTTADLKVEVTGVTNLTGTWTSSLNDGITDADDIAVIGDGPAGKLWRIGEAFDNGSPHGQLYCWHYVTALQDGSGNLAGLRYLGRCMNGWATVATDANRKTVSAVLKSGATTLRTLSGHDTTETPGSNIGWPHYSSFFTAGTDAKYDYVQGGGSQAAEATLRITLDSTAKTYARATGLFAPWDLTISPTDDASVDYYPMGKAALDNRAMGTTGDASYIGPFPRGAAKHFLLQSATMERVCRASGLAVGGWRTCLRRDTNRTLIPTTTNAYTGMTGQPTWVYSLGGSSGYVNPTSNTSLWDGEGSTDHRPNWQYYPYMITAERQFLDLLQELAVEGTSVTTIVGTPNTLNAAPVTGSIFANGEQRNITVGGTTYRGITLVEGSNPTRQAAWKTRCVVQAWRASPDTDPAGTGIKDFLNDLVDDNFAFAVAVNAARGAGWNDGGFWAFDGSGLDTSNWNLGYLYQVVAMAWFMTGGRADIATFRDHLAKRPEKWRSQGLDMAGFTGFYLRSRDESGALIEDATDASFMGQVGNATLSWNAGTDIFTLSAGDNANFTPTNGDVIGFTGSSFPFTASAYQPFYVVNASGNTFQLADTPGGAAKDVTTTLSVGSFWARVANFSPGYSFQNRTGTSTGDVLAIQRAGCRFLKAAGCTTLDDVLTALDADFTAGGGATDATNNPKWTYVTAV